MHAQNAQATQASSAEEIDDWKIYLAPGNHPRWTIISHAACRQASLLSTCYHPIVIDDPRGLLHSAATTDANSVLCFSGNFRAGDEGTIQKRLCGREQECLKQLMLDPLRPYVPEYRGQVCIYVCIPGGKMSHGTGSLWRDFRFCE